MHGSWLRIYQTLLGYQPQQRTIILVTNAPVDEQIGHWNMIEKQYDEVECVAVK
jgi:hypothetical protein